MDDMARALENGVSAWKQCLADNRYLPGGSSIESHIVNEIEKYANTVKSLSQYGCFKFG